jgi:hypothetical protein
MKVIEKRLVSVLCRNWWLLMLRGLAPIATGVPEIVAAIRLRRECEANDVHVSNRNVDFHDENFDLAIRLRAPPDSTMVARHLEDAALWWSRAPEDARLHNALITGHVVQREVLVPRPGKLLKRVAGHVDPAASRSTR